MCEANKRKFIPRDPPSDYECTIIKTTEKKKRQSKSSSSDVPQLGAKKKQSIVPLVVGQTTQQQDFVTFFATTSLGCETPQTDESEWMVDVFCRLPCFGVFEYIHAS